MRTYKGVLVRDRFDEYIVDEQPRVYRQLDLTDRVVLDLGAHIGAFARYAQSRGARLVVCVEPHPTSFQMIASNCPTAHAIHAAVAFPAIGHIAVQSSPYKAYDTSLVAGRNRTGHYIVPTVTVSELIVTYRPTVLKMDIEGSEYMIMDDLFASLDPIEQFAFELHTGQKWMRPLAQEFLDRLTGFEAIRVGKPYNGALTAVFKRRQHKQETES